MTTTVFSVPAISCGTCKTAIETAVGPAHGVEAVEVDIAAQTVTVRHEAPVAELVEVIEDQGYDVAGYH